MPRRLREMTKDDPDKRLIKLLEGAYEAVHGQRKIEIELAARFGAAVADFSDFLQDYVYAGDPYDSDTKPNITEAFVAMLACGAGCSFDGLDAAQARRLRELLGEARRLTIREYAMLDAIADRFGLEVADIHEPLRALAVAYETRGRRPPFSKLREVFNGMAVKELAWRHEDKLGRKHSWGITMPR